MSATILQLLLVRLRINPQTRLCAAQLARTILSARPQQATQRAGGYLLRAVRKFMNARYEPSLLMVKLCVRPPPVQ